MKLTIVGVAGLLLVLGVLNPSDAWVHTWHKGPINCYTCDDYLECSAGTGILRKCLDNDAQSCVAVFANNGSVIQRGCSDNLQESCSGSAEQCYECRSHGCNTLKDNKELIDCVHCDAEMDDNCVFDIELVTERRRCHQHCITALYPRESVAHAPWELVRSCLDDLNYDERESCAEGTLDNCVACSSPSCNTVELGARGSCNHCTAGNCANPQPHTCRAVAADAEHCYIQVDEAGEIYEMGCLSKFNVSEAALLETNKRLWSCSGADNCNVISALPSAQTCKLCSSRTDSDCAVDPLKVESETECQNAVNTDCYMRLLDDGHTERGCLTTLEGENYLECLKAGNDTKCSACSGNGCNNKLHPAERLTCHLCSSSDDTKCETSPDSSSLCLLYTKDQQCVTTIDLKGTTERGCSASLACSSSNPQSCQLCSGSNCNTDNLKRRADGQPGLWEQTLPLTCHSCQSLAECSAPEVAEKKCSSKLDYCMTVFNTEGAVTARGCSSVVESTWSSYCDSNTGNCHNCNSNGCNNAASQEAYTSCIYCDAQNEDCAHNPEAVVTRRLCNGQCMTALKRRSNESEIYDLIRTCLDDKDVADREVCVSGDDVECSACTGAACNVAKLPENPFTCYTCSPGSVACEDAVLKACPNYQPNDRCYMHFDAEGSVDDLGCASDLEADYVDAEFVSLYFCQNEKCNYYTDIPKDQNCLVCDSGDDENCAVDASKISDVDVCSVKPHTGCMTRVLASGVTQRGCVSSLSKTQLKACLQGEGDCEVCEGSMCNKEIYPKDRRRCHRCNSLEDPTCGASPKASSVCPHYLENQNCSTKVVDGATYRGCQKDFSCDDSDKQYCRVCTSKDNCNAVDLESTIIGYPGKWVTPPINCYTCEGSECEDNKLGSLRKCTNNNAQNCATVFGSDGLVQLRSCSDHLYANEEMLQYCDEHPENCKFCKSSGCNDALTLSSYQDCVICDGSEKAECVRDVSGVKRTVSCQGNCFTGLYAHNKSEINPSKHLARGCLDDLEYDDRAACLAGTLEHCVACKDAACNVDDVPEERLSCNFCKDKDCDEIGSQVCVAYRESDQCYIHVGDRKIESMGCASDLTSDFLVQNRRDLYLCSEKDCNTKDNLNLVGVSCAICNSTADARCVAGTGLDEVVCQHYLNPECYTYLNEDGVLTRGCLMDTDDDLFDDCSSGESSSCEICNTNACNTGIYPSDWKSCLRCDSLLDGDCEQNPDKYASYCPVYEADDACVTSLEKTRTRRGCSSEIYCDVGQVGNCRVCEEENCNSVNLMLHYVGEPGKWQDIPLSCLVCEGADNCAADKAETKTCEGNNKQTCSTVFNADGKVVSRGCSDSVRTEHSAYCDEHAENCLQCKSNVCNNAVSLDTYVDCYFCDAEEDANCAWQTPRLKRKCQGQCMSGLYPRSSSPDSALLPTRGCLDDLDEEDRTSCSAGTHDSCTACTGALCNDQDVIKNPQECYVCDDELCEDIRSIKCLGYRPNDECYLAFDASDVVAMGCASDFETQVIKELLAQQRLLLCEGNNCNTPDITPTPNNCLQCSSLDDARCATNPNQLLTTDICSQLPYTHCVTRIDDQGTTTRGCVSSLGGDDFYECLTGDGKHCQTCTGDRCNAVSVFPADRRRCHQCDSKTNADCASTPSSSAVCPIFVENDSCVTTQVEGVTHRGCSSSLSCLDPNDSRTCRICSSGDNCNVVDLDRINADGSPGAWQEVPIKCLTCSGSTECASSGGNLETCESYDNCVTVFDASWVVNQRGCSNNVIEESSYCEEQPDQCPRCNSNGCNTANSLDSYVECLVCDSSQNGVCVSDPTKITKTRRCQAGCMSAFWSRFSEESDPSYALIRNCIDDLEKEDREACMAGSKQFCASCEKDKCNTEDLVARRHKCFICQGDECQDAKSQSCPNYRENDQCYYQFDEQRSLVSLGCLSEFSHEDIHVLKKAKRLVTCDKENCNDLDSLPEPQTCVLCSSRTDFSCAMNPGSVASSSSCELTGIPECYSRVLTDGSTERGCLSSLESDEFLACYNGTSSNCDSCLGDSCNNKVYPTNRLSCHICNSDSDAKCESTPNSLAVCPIYDAADQCVTNLRNGVTHRGCSSSISCEANSKTCVLCEGDGCNLVDLSSKADDNHGKWQDLPLSCLTCEGSACQGESIPSQKCRNNNEQDCLTVFNEDGVVIQRGCEDELEAVESVSTYCAAHPASCPVCKSNDCNSAKQLTEYTSCIYCDSYKDPTCLSEPLSAAHKSRQCQGGCMTALYGSSNNGLDLIRTCLNDKEAKDRDTCQEGKDSTCSACSEKSCNTQVLPENRFSCFTCEGKDCEDPSPQPCAVYKPNDSCFLWVGEENDIKQLGCLSSFRNQDLESVIKTKRIAVCEGENCNKPQMKVPLKCAKCDSKVDPECATNALNVGSFETCTQMPHPDCVTRLEKDGSTTRGCLYDLPQSDFAACILGKDSNCQVCGVDGCNREIFPADRQQCYTCTSADDSNCESNPSHTLACPWVSEWETCKTSLANNVTTRGCSSILDCDLNDYRNCRSCVGTECNAIDLVNRKDDGQHGLFQKLPLKCHTCAGEHCLSSLGPEVECSLNKEQDCKTVFEADGVTVRRRGCSDDVDDYEYRYCRDHPENCFTCKSNSCNDAWNAQEFISCAYCNSETDESCITEPKGLHTRQCKGQCLVALVNQDLIRTCLDDKETFDRTECSSDESGHICASCEKSECNTFNYPADRLKCHVCKDDKCLQSEAKYCRAYSDKDYCFAKYQNGALELMGCASSQNSSDLESWKDENKLYSCTDNECNELSRLPKDDECIACDSSKTTACAQHPESVTTTITCHAPLSDCVTRLDGGHTIRGCLSELSSFESDSCVANGSCSGCAGSKCNSQIFPEGRRKCHICNSASDPECAKNPNALAVCPVYAVDDQCVASLDKNYHLKRGCASEIKCEIDNEDHCQTCPTDGCNTAQLTGAAGQLASGIGLALTLLLAWAVSQWRL